MKRFKLDLHLFDGAGAAPGGEGMSVSAGDATGMGGGQVDATPGDTRPTFEELIKGEYKADADKYIQGIVRDRVKATKATIQAQGDILEIVAAKYGMDTSDLEALKTRVSEDDTYYEDRAMEEGLTVDQYKRIAQAEAKSRAYEAQMQAEQRERDMQAQVQIWQDQAEQVKQVYPDFDLREELANPTFTKLLSSGVDMRSAYVATHEAQILEGAMSYTAQEVRKATVNEISSKGSRPRENASSSQAAARVGTDVSKLTRKDREELSRRAMAGEIVTLR